MTERAKFTGRLLLLFSTAVLFYCANAEVQAVRGMRINHVDVSKVKDGDYLGAFAYGGFNYVVRVNVVDHQIVDVLILKNRTTKWAKKAERVAKSILDQQRNDVDAISGATTTSKAFLKAVENALEKGL